MSIFIELKDIESRQGVVKEEGKTKTGISWTVYTGDAFDVLRQLPDKSYNCVITSPPYYNLRDYKIEGQIGLEDQVGEYVEAISLVIKEVMRVLKDDGILFLNLGDTYYSGKGKSHGIDPKSRKRRFGLRPVDKSGGLGLGLKQKTLIGIPWRVAIKLIEQGLILRSSIIWYRKHSLPESVEDRPRRSYENVFMFVKNRTYYFNRTPLVNEEQEDMWTIIARPRPSNGLPTSPFPDELVARCLDVGCPAGGSVLDPFAGSGTALRVSVKSGRPATGIDLNPDFCKYIVNELYKL